MRFGLTSIYTAKHVGMAPSLKSWLQHYILLLYIIYCQTPKGKQESAAMLADLLHYVLILLWQHAHFQNASMLMCGRCMFHISNQCVNMLPFVKNKEQSRDEGKSSLVQVCGNKCGSMKFGPDKCACMPHCQHGQNSKS